MIYILAGIGCILGAIVLVVNCVSDGWWETIKFASELAGMVGLLVAGGFLLHIGLGG